MVDPLSTAVVAVLLNMGSIAGEAALGHMATRAAEAGLKEVASMWTRSLRDRGQQGAIPVREAEERQVTAEVQAHPRAAAELLNHALTVDPGGDRLERLELFLAGTFSLLAEVPPGIVALPGSLCSRDSFTVVDLRRSDDGRLRMPSTTEAVDDYLFFPSTDVSVAVGVPRIWIGRPPPPLTSAALVERLNESFVNPPRDRIGRPESLPPQRYSAEVLARSAGLAGEHVWSVGKVQSLYADRVQLSAEAEAHVPSAASDDQVFDRLLANAAADRSVREKQADAGVDWDFLQLNADGIQAFRTSVKRAYIGEQKRKARTESRIEEELARPLLAEEPDEREEPDGG